MSPPAPRTVWITGAAGFIGRRLAPWLGRRGDRVVGVGHGAMSAQEALALGMIGFLSGDVDRDVLEAALRTSGPPDLVCHLAGGATVGASIADPEADRRRTVGTTAALLKVLGAEAPGARLLCVSSAAVYGAGHAGPIAETAPLRPFSPYGAHKAEMEALCLEAARRGQPVAVARLFSVFGPGLRKQLPWDLCRRLAERPQSLALGGGGDETRDWTPVDEVCRALDLIAAQASPERPVFNVGGGVGRTVREVAETLARAWGGDTQIVFNGERRPGDPHSLVADPGRLRALGFAWAGEFEADMADYARWAQSALAAEPVP